MFKKVFEERINSLIRASAGIPPEKVLYLIRQADSRTHIDVQQEIAQSTKNPEQLLVTHNQDLRKNRP